MSEFSNQVDKDGFHCKLWRGERMALIGLDVEDPEPDLVGFSIEFKGPGERNFKPLLNRLAFSYDRPAREAVSGARLFDSREAPFQKFRWVHFPSEPKDGRYCYRVTKRHMRNDETLVAGTSMELDLSLAQVTYDDMVDIGFTRNFASSQAYREQFESSSNIIPATSEEGLEFEKVDIENDRGMSVYKWLGFEAHDHIFSLLDEAVNDRSIRLEVMVYDLNEPDILERLERLKKRLRIIIDDSVSSKNGEKVGHGTIHSPESIAAKRLRVSAGENNVKRTHFHNLQHHKIFVMWKDGVPVKVLCGSTNFTFRGLYIQANNILVFHAQPVAEIFARMFDLAFDDPKGFRSHPFSKQWHVVHLPSRPSIHLCFSPHSSTDLSLNPIRAAIDQATSSVFYSVAFLSQMKKGPTIEAFERLMSRPIFSYGTADRRGQLTLKKPDGSVGLVDSSYLGKNSPEPFRSEWFGGKGRNVHHKFLVTDFSLPSAKVFTGSSNFSPSGEEGNGDHLIMIQDSKIATAFAIEAVRVFDHLQFRNRMRDVLEREGSRAARSWAPAKLTLRKPRSITGRPAWYERFFISDSQAERDRLLFSH